jgi:hypothetical protein
MTINAAGCKREAEWLMNRKSARITQVLRRAFPNGGTLCKPGTGLTRLNASSSEHGEGGEDSGIIQGETLIWGADLCLVSKYTLLLSAIGLWGGDHFKRK